MKRILPEDLVRVVLLPCDSVRSPVRLTSTPAGRSVIRPWYDSYRLRCTRRAFCTLAPSKLSTLTIAMRGAYAPSARSSQSKC